MHQPIDASETEKKLIENEKQKKMLQKIIEKKKIKMHVSFVRNLYILHVKRGNILLKIIMKWKMRKFKCRYTMDISNNKKYCWKKNIWRKKKMEKK